MMDDHVISNMEQAYRIKTNPDYVSELAERHRQQQQTAWAIQHALKAMIAVLSVVFVALLLAVWYLSTI